MSIVKYLKTQEDFDANNFSGKDILYYCENNNYIQWKYVDQQGEIHQGTSESFAGMEAVAEYTGYKPRLTLETLMEIKRILNEISDEMHHPTQPILVSLQTIERDIRRAKSCIAKYLNPENFE